MSEGSKLRPQMSIEQFHQRQQGTLPERYGFTVTELSEGRLVAQMALQPWMWAPNGFLHAASIIMLADTCCGYGCIAHLPDEAKSFTTIELKSNFMGTAKDGTITCETLAEHLGKTTQVWSSTVKAASGKTMALFRCTQIVLY
jgi:1,4-dihydroxy-2-naphthoyl-CoA hydrolase